MRLVKKSIDDRSSGSVIVVPEEPEDMWHAYNLVRPNDILRAPAVRRVKKTQSDTGCSMSQRICVTLTIRVIKIDFDAGASQLHVSGQVVAENDWVSIGAHHTLDLELQRSFTLEKEGGWDSVALATLEEAVDATNQAQIWAVIMTEGTASICLITEHQSILRQRVNVPIPRKRLSSSSIAKDKTSKFHNTLLQTLLRDMNLSNNTNSPHLPLLLASPGFSASSFLSFMKSYAAAMTDSKEVRALANRTVVAHVGTPHLAALSSLLANPEISAKLANSKYARDTTLMNRFFGLLHKDDGRAWYGPREVEHAVEVGAVGRGGGILIISNKLFRAECALERRRWVSLVDVVKKTWGGEVRVLSSAHESGRRLDALGCIAAILTYPVFYNDDALEGSDVDGV